MPPLPERLAQPVAERVVALVVDALDLDGVFARVDINALLDRVDLDELLDRVDLDPVLDRVDVNALLARIDVNGLLAQVDVDALVARTDLAATMASTASDVADSTLRTLRRRLAEADAWVGGRADALMGRADVPPRPDAGAVSRLLAYIVDHVTLTVAFSVGATVVGFLVRLLTGHRLDASANLTAGVALSVWWFAYFAVSWATTGRSVGMGLVGVRVVQLDLEPVGAGRAVVRTLAWPLSAALFGLGFIGILVHPRRRALHDLIAATRVVHDAPPERRGP